MVGKYITFPYSMSPKIRNKVFEWLGVVNLVQNVGCAYFTSFGGLLPCRLKKVRL
jgi:hypothetical protein